MRTRDIKMSKTQFLFLYFQREDHNIPPFQSVMSLSSMVCQSPISTILDPLLWSVVFPSATFYFYVLWVAWTAAWTLWIHCRKYRRRILLAGGRWLPGDPEWLLHNYTTTTLGKETKYTTPIDCNVHIGKCVYFMRKWSPCLVQLFRLGSAHVELE